MHQVTRILSAIDQSDPHRNRKALLDLRSRWLYSELNDSDPPPNP